MDMDGVNTTSTPGQSSSVASTPAWSSVSEMADVVADSGGGGSAGAVPLADSTSGSARRERGVIAAQACEACRIRKQRCDERRPRCGTCVRFKLGCQYREPQPTKKDKTLGEILDRLKTIESKIDDLSAAPAFHARVRTTEAALPGVSAPGPIDPGLVTELGGMASSSGPLGYQNPLWLPLPHPPLRPSLGQMSLYRYAPALYQLLCWPMVEQLLRLPVHRLPGIPPLSTESDALQLVLGLHQPSSQLPQDTAVFSADEAALPGMPGLPGLPGLLADPATSSDPFSPALTWDSVFRLSQAYFDTFNCVFPIIDRQTFQSGTLTAAFGGLDDHGGGGGGAFDDSTTLTFLVAALGEAALAGYGGDGHPGSGVQGGSAPCEQPAGLAFFNEARKRMGFSLGRCSLETAQIYALAGIYCGTCFRHMESWRFTTTASLACQALITSNPSELASPHVDLIRRIFWYCLIVETHFHIELGLPLTGLDKYEALVGLPDFSGPFSHDDYLANEVSHFQEYFASQIVLRRLFTAFHSTLSALVVSPAMSASPSSLSSSSLLPPFSSSSPSPSTSSSSSSSSLSLPLLAAVGQMALQLDEWRGLLPPSLSWSEPSLGTHPHPGVGGHVPSSGGGSSEKVDSTLFAADLTVPPAQHPFALDVQVALLRTRYYSIKYLMYQPFLYKALHYPAQMTVDDTVAAAQCLQACLQWPGALAMARTHKRLVPCLFVVTQTMLGILVLLRLTQQMPSLPRILSIVYGGERGRGGKRRTSSDPVTISIRRQYERDVRATVALCTDWIRDLRDVDSAAEWAWQVAKGLYHLSE